ncbi:GPI mannosyltransferase 2 [Parastagonospora nodorum]|nr:GPI mannosyltransferase 2 [Parastagonospora nodorum]KAH4023181.1 GPI mannosyltransferase 2 [Parastagonospora nodorum]KAH6231875.1 GPI mannosyltransferase 2 [Parastagonospora nodorum]KAH6319031.1 GPI mannosyltransferase 2 [Parastagonospora nodorum]
MATPNTERKSPSTQLVVIFLLWKTLLHVLATFCPGPGYDTSALILVEPSVKRHVNFSVASWSDRLALNLFRWDSLYFIKAAERGKYHEQEWAFSWAYSWLLDYYLMTGIVVSNVCHLLSVLALYQLLTTTVDPRRKHRVAFIGAVLHVMNPASLFLSSPYAEAPFSLLNITGMLLYTRSRIRAQTQQPSLREDAYKLGSGIFFGFATLMRGNGLLSGLILLYDVARYLPRVFSMRLTVHDMRRIVVTCVAGSVVALGFIWPQYLAYTEYCTGDRSVGSPPWCKKTIPSIYSWVQSHYWNVGLFRYWTLPNVPLFVIAAPMLWLLLVSSGTVLCSPLKPLLHGRPVPQHGATSDPTETSATAHYVPELALPQFVLAVAAIVSFHVQIVNRLASGYPTWYLMVATWLVDDSATSSYSKPQRQSRWIVRGMISYAIAQGMLFANFLPPA